MRSVCRCENTSSTRARFWGATHLEGSQVTKTRTFVRMLTLLAQNSNAFENDSKEPVIS